MEDPKEILTPDGVAKFDCHLHNLDEARFWFMNHWEDLGLTEDDHDAMVSLASFVDRVQEGLKEFEELRVEHSIPRQSDEVVYTVSHPSIDPVTLQSDCHRNAAYEFGQMFKLLSGWITVSNADEGEAKFYLEES